jgi:hypothetical protein
MYKTHKILYFWQGPCVIGMSNDPVKKQKLMSLYASESGLGWSTHQRAIQYAYVNALTSELIILLSFVHYMQMSVNC